MKCVKIGMCPVRLFFFLQWHLPPFSVCRISHVSILNLMWFKLLRYNLERNLTMWWYFRLLRSHCTYHSMACFNTDQIQKNDAFETRFYIKLLDWLKIRGNDSFHYYYTNNGSHEIQLSDAKWCLSNSDQSILRVTSTPTRLNNFVEKSTCASIRAIRFVL